MGCVGHGPCEQCGSSDANARYEDGSRYCFSCRTYSAPAGGDMADREGSGESRDWSPIQGDYRALSSRGLDEADCRHWGYQQGQHPTLGSVHIANVRDAAGKLIGQKYRTKDKRFQWATDTKEHPLYGVWLWPSQGKSIVITEGELDALSVSAAFAHKYPVVSLPDGADSVKRSVKTSYDWLTGFDKICLWFDADEPGQKAVETAVELLPPGKVWIIRSPEGCKDASDTLVKHGKAVVTKCYWNAVQYRPDGIADGREFTRESVKQAMDVGYPMPWPDLQDRLYGLRKRELTLLTAGAGMGKSTMARELAYYLRKEHDCKIGNVFLEEQSTTTVQAYVALDNSVPLGDLRRNPEAISDEAWDNSLASVVWDGMWFYRHFGSQQTDTLINKITYMAKVCGVDFVVLDHISIVVSGLESSSEGERKDLDQLMTKLQQCVQETGVGILAVVHLKRKPGSSFNEGAQVSLTDLRGSAALEQLSHNVLALERNQQAEGEESQKMRIRVLKCRETGSTGLSDTLIYNRNTGRLELSAADFKDEEF